MAVPDWIWFVFIFAFGCCIGSFLNVVIYRLPRDKSLIRPASACPACGKHIRFYDNIPLISWLVLGRKCRYCKATISPRYFVIELLTGSVFAGFFYVYFYTNLRSGVGSFLGGGWYIYLISIILLAVLIAASAIDLELWVIPLSICWFVTAVGLIGSAIGVFIIEAEVIRNYVLLPLASAKTSALAVGAVIGLAISLALLAVGVIKRSYEAEDRKQKTEDRKQKTEDRKQKTEDRKQKTEDRKQKTEDRKQKTEDRKQKTEDRKQKTEDGSEQKFNHRLEVCKEVVFLLPIIICSLAAYRICQNNLSIRIWWADFSQYPFVAGLLGSLWGYFVGCGVVWATRIFGTLAFGKEAMGLGDVHLMGAAGAVIGPVFVVVAFLIAPFFGLAWAGFQMFFKKIRQIPYGPFLSLGILAAMIFHDWILNYLKFMFYR